MVRNTRPNRLRLLRWFVGIGMLAPQPAFSAQPATATVPVHLAVQAGTPLRLYLTKRVLYKQGARVAAKLLVPVWTFDRVTIPAGSIATGSIVQLQPVSKTVRAMAIVRGDFTPLKLAEINFDTIVLPAGRTLRLRTQDSPWLGSIYTEPKKTAKPPRSAPRNTNLAKIKALARQQAQSAANARTRGLFELVHAPNRKQWLEEFLLDKLPYHPQWFPAGARFDAVLDEAIDFGTAAVPETEFAPPDAMPGEEQSATLRLDNSIDSSDARPGDAVNATLDAPLFSNDHRLMFPQSTHFAGKVTLARRAHMFHRGGRLRFTFDRITPPAEFANAFSRESEHTQAQMNAVQQGATAVSVDDEGTAKATESKSRFLRPLVAGLIAAKSMDNDTGKVGSSSAGANTSGRSLGGFSGFGLLGTLVARAPKSVGSAFGFYGLAWSVYSTVVARGKDVAFEKNTPVEIRFSPR